MRGKHWFLIALAIAAFLVTLILFLPATMIAGQLPSNVGTGTLTGTVWNGAADAVTLDGRLLGAARWRVRPLQLFRGRLALEAELVRNDGVARGRITMGLGRTVEIADFEARAPLAALPLAALPRGWSGDLEVQASKLEFSAGALNSAAGAVDLRNLREPPPGGVALGSYRLTFDESARQGETLVGQLQDLEGPMEVRGTLTLGPGRNYVIDGQVAARAGAPAVMADRLRYLGNPDSAGRRPFSVAGTY